MLAGAALLGWTVLLLPSAAMAFSRRHFQSENGWPLFVQCSWMVWRLTRALGQLQPSLDCKYDKMLEDARAIRKPALTLNSRQLVNRRWPVSMSFLHNESCARLCFSSRTAAASSSHPECNLVSWRCSRLAGLQPVSTMQTMLKGAAYLQVGLGAAVCQDHRQPCPCSNVCAQCRPPRLPPLASPGLLHLCQSGTMRGG